MVKKFTLMFLLGIFGLFSTNLFAQEDATIDPADIKFWIGEGESEVVFIVNWAEPDTALAWGYRFVGENVVMKTIMDDIAAADYRFSYEASGFINDLHFNDGVLDLSLVEAGWLTYLINGESTWDTYDVALVSDGEYVKIGDTHCGTMIDPENWIYVYEKEVAPVYALGEEATIDPSEILYWIGEGENEAIFAVNFADPEDVCFAWGYRFDGESVTIKEMMEAIAAVDQRFAFNDEPSSWGGYMLTDLTFNYNEVHYELSGYNAMYNVNGVQSWYTFDEQTVINGDFVKWGDYTIGTEIAAWTYVWETPVQPVTAYDAVGEVDAFEMSVYPNPATDFIMVNVETQNFVSVQIYDVMGRNVLTTTETAIDLRSMEAGVYFVTVRSANSAKTTKLIVK
ncbi:MAG: T9SS type A sorting domain-containing protein [Bacteroidales bacterium]|nr:T9SS type A sorting domain-containing protein [Bacteroidales bacterium]